MFFLGGDFRFFYPENIKDFISFPFAWDSSLNTGLGQSQLSSLWITSYFNFTAFFSKLGLSWNLIQLFFFIIPALLLSFFSSFYLFKTLFKFKVQYSVLSGIVYAFNTYFLMILTGGQLGVSLSYSIIPLVLLRFIKLVEKPSLRNAIIGGLILALQVIFDPRVVYITLVAIFLYSIFNFFEIKKIINNSLVFFISPLVIAVLVNIFWILPLILTKNSLLPAGFESAESFKFFSFADFSHSLSLLHPNWPENIFGKIYFLDPKFLALPIIAFGSLIFVKNKNILHFAVITLLGIFLAKGANPPFGDVNTFLFQNFPGMSMFRDPTKWYILIALGYSILIPYTLKAISKYFKLASILFAIYFLYLSFSIFGQIKVNQIPQEYVKLENFLDSQKTFFRTLWIPKWQRFGYFSNLHPAIGREELLKGSLDKQISKLDQNLLMDLSVKYVVIPYDSESEIFLNDRKYDSKQYETAVQKLKKIKWLKEIGDFGKVRVFEVTNPKDHFWSTSKDLKISYLFINPNEFRVQLTNARKGDILVFSEGFDKNWIAENSKLKVSSSKFEDLINSFILPEDGNYELKIYYTPQKYVETGMFMSLATMLAALAGLKFGKKAKK